LPQKRYGHTASIIDNKLFIFGGAYRKGNGASPFHSFYECSLKIDAQRDDLFKWKRIMGEAPKTRDSHSCVSFLD
jgi:leucine-zipper-like transcriptional regulator 1